MVEQIRNAKAYPKNKAKQRDGIDTDYAAKTFSPKLAHIGDESNG